jgi:NAD(P) transhydrogenase subunit alpha
MKLIALKQHDVDDPRVPLLPDHVRRLTALGFEVHLELNFGASVHIADHHYAEQGAKIQEAPTLMHDADVLVSLQVPSVDALQALPAGARVVSFFEPFSRFDALKATVQGGLEAWCMELVPRTSYAQKMDALSSQASLAGYAAVVQATAVSPKVFPMMSTPAGTIKPARVFVVGVGVAGLQAIATAKRLGARVDAYDTRPAVADQVKSLGARFVELDIGETGQTDQGYAKALTDAQLELQREQMAAVVAQSDVVITTAQLFGRPAPRIIDDAMVAGMTPGGVVVDMAASSGGNVEGSEANRTVVRHGITIMGRAQWASAVALDASAMYGANVVNLLDHAWRPETSDFVGADDDELLAAVSLVRGGHVLNERVAERWEDFEEDVT